MDKFKLQTFSDGYIYKHKDGSYSVETSRGEGVGSTVTEALNSLTSNINERFTEVVIEKVIVKRRRSNKK